jgi:hypothetical protein
MKNIFTLIAFIILSIFGGLSVKAQTSPKPVPTLEVSMPWTNSQLIAPAILADHLKETGPNGYLILNIGAVQDIQGAKHIGAVNNAENMEGLKNAVITLPKNTPLVIYCGCCPFAKCPNIKPAYLEMQKLGFTNIKVLDLPVNLKTNWIAKGYPLAGK